MSAVDALARLATAALAVGLTATCALPARADELTLPPPVYATTELSSVPLEQIGPSACETLIPTGETPEDLPWHLSRLRMEEVWTLATGKGVRIALIDTGVQVSGSEHTPARRFQAFNVLPAQSGQAADDKWNCIHGTIVASLAGAQAVDGPTRFAGIAPEAQIIGIRALYGTQAQEIDGVVAAVRAATEMGVDVINISQAANINRGEYAEAVQAALDAGIVVVAAAGNASAMGGAPLAYPAAYPGVISVGMTDAADVANPDSMAMPGRVSVAAPGVGLTALAPSSADTGQVYAFGQTGTSYATPIVSGVVALLIERSRAAGQELTPAQIKQRLEQTADAPAGPVPDDQLGYGVINPLRALTGIEAVQPQAEVTSAPDVPADDRPAPRRRSLAALRAALVVAAVSLVGVGGGYALTVALPAARARGGRPAGREEN